jgi:hypothetical protein
MSQFNPDLKQQVCSEGRTGPARREKISEIATVSMGFLRTIHKSGTASIQEPSMMPTRGLAQLP